jgi:hypothetical protein
MYEKKTQKFYFNSIKYLYMMRFMHKLISILLLSKRAILSVANFSFFFPLTVLKILARARL